MKEYLARQMEWSRRTFGEGKRTGGITQHIEKELAEIRADPKDRKEWIDVIILAMDGYWRAGGTPDSLPTELEDKQLVNMARQWPTPLSEDVAVEHVRDEPVRKSCNRHDDCEAAEEAILTLNPGLRINASFHCRDECCEDCFGS